VTVTVDRQRTSLHEAGHTAGLLIACRWLPKRVTADRPAERVLGRMELDWETKALEPKLARGLILAILLGPLAEECEPPTWPLDVEVDGDERHLALLAAHLRLEETDWRMLVTEAELIATSPTFQRLVRLLSRALELVDELSADEIRDLIGPRTCATFGLSTHDEEQSIAA
jgi:hypothetical protein